MARPPDGCWTRCLAEPAPSPAVHKCARPPVLEVVSLLPVAFRVGTYVHKERAAGREPIFDMSGLTLAPPHPGPVAGVPCGGLGGGCVGRGYAGEFRRWSLHPGRYVHRVVPADQFSLRVRYANGVVRSQVRSSSSGSRGGGLSHAPVRLLTSLNTGPLFVP